MAITETDASRSPGPEAVPAAAIHERGGFVSPAIDDVAPRRSQCRIVGRVSASQWTKRAAKAIDRAFLEFVESERWEFWIGADDGAIAELAAIQDDEVPAHSRMDLLIAQHATTTNTEVIRAIARLFASSQLPDRMQAPNGRRPEDADDDDVGPSDILQFLEEQARAGSLFRSGLTAGSAVEVEQSEPSPEPPADTRPPPGHRLTHRTLTTMHIRTVRAYAETLCEPELVRQCDEALGPPMTALDSAMELRRRLAGLYNAWFIDEGVVLRNHWTARAWRKVALAAGRFFHEPDDLRSPSDEDPSDEDAALDPPRRLTMFDPVAEVHALLHEVQPDDVPDEDQDDLRRVKTATSYDLATLRSMGRLWSNALWWRLCRLQDEIGRPPVDPS